MSHTEERVPFMRAAGILGKEPQRTPEKLRTRPRTTEDPMAETFALIQDLSLLKKKWGEDISRLKELVEEHPEVKNFLLEGLKLGNLPETTSHFSGESPGAASAASSTAPSASLTKEPPGKKQKKFPESRKAKQKANRETALEGLKGLFSAKDADHLTARLFELQSRVRGAFNKEDPSFPEIEEAEKRFFKAVKEKDLETLKSFSPEFFSHPMEEK